MRGLLAQPTPVYAPSSRGLTQRVFPASSGLLTLTSRLSSIYRQGWATYDLVAAQTAINSIDWGADVTADFLARNVGTPGALWVHLAGNVGKEVAEAKGPLKTALYSVQYGKALDAVALCLDRDLGVGAGQAFANDTMIIDLVRARDAQLDRIARDGGLMGAFGEWIGLEPVRDAPSVAADRAQGVELLLLYPALMLAQKTDRWDIVAWQHDGFDVAVRDRNRLHQADREIRAAVDAECWRRGYPTRLVADRLPRDPDPDRPAPAVGAGRSPQPTGGQCV